MTYQSVKLTIRLLMFSFSVFFVLPLAIAYFSNGLAKEDVAKRIPEKFRSQYSTNQKNIREIDSALVSTRHELTFDTPTDIEAKIAKIKFLETERKEMEATFRIAGISYNRLAFIYPLSIFLLLFIYYVLLKNKNSYNFITQLKVIVPVYAFQASFMWYRNSPFGQTGRRVFSAYNIDINPCMYFFQEISIMTFFTLVVLIWHKIFSELKDIKQMEVNDTSIKEVMNVIVSTKNSYRRWQLLSVLLFGIFGFYSYHYWLSVYRTQDTRYIYQAISFNLIWVLTWAVCSMPMLKRLEFWNGFKLTMLLKDDRNEDDYNLPNLQVYLSSSPVVSTSNQILSTIVMILSFLFPLINAMAP